MAMLTGCGNKTSDNPGEAMKERYSKYVDLGSYKDIQYTPTETAITEEDVDKKVNQLVTQNATKVEKKTGVAMQGDTVNIDYVGTIDGVEFSGGNTGGAGREITLGSSGYVDNFDEQIEGHSPGETFDVKVTFPEDYGKEELNGKPAVFKTTLNYIVSQEYPELTDAFVAEKTEYKTVQEYREATQAEMVKEQAEKDLETDKESMMTQIIDTSTVKQYPQSDIEDRTKMLTEQLTSTAQAYGMTADQYLAAINYTADQFQTEIRNAVEESIKRKMIVCAIATKEDISVSKEEADAKIKELLESSGLSDVSELNQRAGYKDEDYYYIVMEEKVLDFVYGNAVKKEKDTGETVVEDDTQTANTEAGSTEAGSSEAGSTEAGSTEAVGAEPGSAEGETATTAPLEGETEAAQ